MVAKWRRQLILDRWKARFGHPVSVVLVSLARANVRA